MIITPHFIFTVNFKNTHKNLFSQKSGIAPEETPKSIITKK